MKDTIKRYHALFADVLLITQICQNTGDLKSIWNNKTQNNQIENNQIINYKNDECTDNDYLEEYISM